MGSASQTDSCACNYAAAMTHHRANRAMEERNDQAVRRALDSGEVGEIDALVGEISMSFASNPEVCACGCRPAGGTNARSGNARSSRSSVRHPNLCSRRSGGDLGGSARTL